MNDLDRLREAFEDKLSSAGSPERVARLAAVDYRPRQRRLAVSRRPVLALTLSIAVIGVVLAVVILAAGGGSSPPTLTGAEAAYLSEFPVLARPQTAAEHAAGVALNRELAEYPVLAEPQTPGDRSETGPAQQLNDAAQETSGAHGRLHYTVRYISSAGYRNLPRFTREVTMDGVQVWFFVVNRTRTTRLPRVVVSGNDPAGAAPLTSRRARAAVLATLNANTGEQLWVRVGNHGRPWRITRARFRGQRSATARAVLQADFAVWNASLPGPHGTVVAIVPAGVARITWTWPREFDTSDLRFLTRTRLSAPVTSDVAVAQAPARFSSPEQIGPYRVLYTDAAGRIVGSYANAEFSATAYAATTAVLTRPGPPTALSRAAQRDPSVPNRVVILPDSAILGNGDRPTDAQNPNLGPLVLFKVLLDHEGYWSRITSEPHPGCVQRRGWTALSHAAIEDRDFIGPMLRGETYADGLPPEGILCRGTYRVAVSVISPAGHLYRPFGSATFTIR